MYINVKGIQDYFLWVQLGGFLIFLFLFFNLNSGVFAVTVSHSTKTDITSFSEVTFTKMQDIAYGLSGFFGGINRKAGDNVSNINNQKNDLVVMEMTFKSFNDSVNGLVQSVEDDDSDIEPEIEQPLVYPNPFRQSTDSGAVLSYNLSKDFSFEIHIYNMLAQRVFKQTFQEGFLGARKGANRLQINRESLGGYLLASGVYFYVFVHNQDVLAKGKMVVKP
ncbi:hypothetical protein CL647_03385 [bacterium]|nr:hypothetical protein [Actinomycetota bacterium]MBE33149.1 hypothetical protein [bacterium]